jgi:hypothetical protein
MPCCIRAQRLGTAATLTRMSLLDAGAGAGGGLNSDAWGDAVPPEEGVNVNVVVDGDIEVGDYGAGHGDVDS